MWATKIGEHRPLQAVWLPRFPSEWAMLSFCLFLNRKKMSITPDWGWDGVRLSKDYFDLFCWH